MSSKLSPKTQKTQYTMTKSDLRFYKMSSLFFILCAIIFFVLKIMDSAGYKITSGNNLPYELYNFFRHPAYIAVVSVLFLASVVWLIVSKVKRVDESMKLITSTNAFAAILYVAGFSLYYGVKGRLYAAESVFVIAITVALALIYYISKIYNYDFLTFSIENALLAVLLYKYQHITGVSGFVGKILLIFAFVAVGWVLIKKLNQSKSRISGSKNQRPLMFPYFITVAIWAVCMFVPGTVGLAKEIMLTVMLVQYIIFAIIYTIKLIRE